LQAPHGAIAVLRNLMQSYILFFIQTKLFKRKDGFYLKKSLINDCRSNNAAPQIMTYENNKF
jgi:hypothetical protein